jgi:uncharacterized protein with ParB-like and HNH nuclease domain
MVEEKIKAGEVYLNDLYSPKYVFHIPGFQRPFSWEKEHFERLFEDVRDALIANKDNFGKELGQYEPYFLGTEILWIKSLKDDGSGEYDIIDGQQRLVSLAILMAVLRDSTSTQKAKDTLQARIFQEENQFEGTKATVRIVVRERDSDFFQKYVLARNGTNDTSGIDWNQLNESQQHMFQAIQTFKNGLLKDDGDLDRDLVDEYTKFLLQKVIMVVVRTHTLSSAFRLFNVVNARGMPLGNADLLKSENLGVIPGAEMDKYTKTWEAIEEDQGSETLDSLISFLRTMYMKEKARKSIYEEFEEKIFKDNPSLRGKKFIDQLQRIAAIFQEKIDDASVKTGKSEEEIHFHNLVALMRDFLPFNDWMAAVLAFKEKFTDDSYLFEFVNKLERRIAVDWIIGLTLSQRLGQVYRVIKLIEDSSKPEEVLQNALFVDEIVAKKNGFEEALEDQKMYGKASGRIPKYILLRIDMERKDNLNKQFTYRGDITVEHILPKTPTHAYWISRFDKVAMLECTNRLGNLVLLNGKKNTEASNKPFPDKCKNYFEKRSDFDITNELKALSDWTVDSFKERQLALEKEAIGTWKL